MAPKRKFGGTMESFLESQLEAQHESSNSHSQADEDGSSASSDIRKGRGPALSILEWGTGQTLHLEFDSSWDPIGPNQKFLKTQLGHIAKNGMMAPLTYLEWSYMPNDLLDRIWKEVKDNTNAPEQYRIKCLANIGSLWRGWKSRVKKDYYTELGTDEKRLAITPSRVIREQWVTLVKYWNTERAQNIASKNKTNRSSQSLFHKTGRTPFSEIRNRLEKKGKKTDRVSMFIETRSRIDKDSKKKVIDKEAAKVISQFEEHLSCIPEEEQNDIVREHVFTQVMGPDDHGRVRLYGTGTSANVAQNLTVDEMRVELDELRSNYKDLQLKYEKLESIVMSHYETCPQVQSQSEQIQDNSSTHQPHQSSSGH